MSAEFAQLGDVLVLRDGTTKKPSLATIEERMSGNIEQRLVSPLAYYGMSIEEYLVNRDAAGMILHKISHGVITLSDVHPWKRWSVTKLPTGTYWWDPSQNVVTDAATQFTGPHVGYFEDITSDALLLGSSSGFWRAACCSGGWRS